jgi:TPR repeat protein
VTLIISVGEEQKFPWIKHEAPAQKVLDDARACINAEKFEEAYRLLMPLIAAGNAEAMYLGAGFSLANEKSEEYERRHLELIVQSAGKDYPPALYVIGVYHDTGEMVSVDKAKAAQFFKRAAELKHAHSQCIHGIDLLYGTNGIEKDEQRGIQYILESAKAKFRGALETLARFYEKGEFGFPVDLQKANSFRAQASGKDVIGY